MRGNKSLRVCPTVNNEAGSIHLERSQEKHTACRMVLKWNNSLAELRWTADMKARLWEGVVCEKLGTRIQLVCVCA